MHPAVRSAAKTKWRNSAIKALTLSDIDLDEFTVMDGQLDRAKAQRIQCIKHTANGL